MNICIVFSLVTNKREITVPQHCASPLSTDFSVVRQLSSPYVWLCVQVFLLPANSPIKIRLWFRILGASHTNRMSPVFLPIVYAEISIPSTKIFD